jgi:LytS/YehU family sensor histidine kinase
MMALVQTSAQVLLVGTVGAVVYASLMRALRARAAFDAAAVERASAQRRVLTTRLSALQAQVEPAFLFDTLAQIETLCGKASDAAERVLDHLIEYLRAALPQSRSEGSTLGRETRLVEAYLAIVQSRMGGRLAFSVAVPDELAEANFAATLLLPLVDNALRHGIEPLPLGGRVDVRAERRDDRLRVVVADTGAGDPTAIREGEGLRVLRERLGELFGEAGRFSLQSNGAHGTAAILEVPYEGMPIQGAGWLADVGTQ